MWRLALLVLTFPLLPAAAHADLGWKEAAYVKRYGEPVRSPLTPDQIQFPLRPDGHLLVRFEHHRSREEVWVIGGDAGIVPASLTPRVRRARQAPPVQRVVFQVRGVPPAEVFETQTGRDYVQVDVRKGVTFRVAQCHEHCLLLRQLLAMEQQSDALMARTERALRRQGK